MRRSAVETGFLGASPPRRLRSVRAQDPLLWLYRGVGDLFRLPAVSLLFGAALYGTVQAGMQLMAQSPATTLAYAAFLLIAAVLLAAGLCAGSRHAERARPRSLASVLITLWQRKTHLLMLALTVTALALGWFQLASHVLIVDLATSGASVDAFSLSAATPGWAAIVSLALLTTVMTVLIVGATSVALPLVIDGDDDFLKAMLTSLQVFARSPGAALLWMLAVAATVAIGMFVSQLAMVVFITVLGHATWHGYRATVEKHSP